MKFERDESFSPITITLEDAKEAAALAAVLAGTVGNRAGDDVAYKIYNELDGALDWRATYTYTGRLEIKEV